MNLTNLNRIQTKQKMILITTIFLVFDLFIFYFIISPNISNIKSIRNNILSQKINLKKRTIKEKKINQLKEKVKKINPQINKFDEFFINKNRELEFITKLEGIASQNNVSQKINFNSTNAKNNEIYKKIPLSLKVNGKYKNIIYYLIDLESANYFINIKNLKISKNRERQNAETPSAADVQLTLSADTYWH